MHTDRATEVRFSAADGRRFAFTVSAALAVLAAILYWRDRDRGATVCVALALLLVAAALIAPSRLAPVERSWMALARMISRVTTPVFMAIIYFGVLSPVALLRRAMGKNALIRVRSGKSFWVAREKSGDAERIRRRMERQF